MMRKMRVRLLSTAALLAGLCAGHSAKAADLYSFESGLDGFVGLSAATSAETTFGVTDGSTSLKYQIGGAGFVGARTETVLPAALNNPPGVQSILFDLTVVSLDPLLTFADIGVTIFGHDIDNGVFGIQNQFTDTVSIVTLGPGTHTDLKIDLDSEFNSGLSFNEIFGDDVSDLDVASGFQFYISKTEGVGLTVYIDNVRTIVPEPTTGLLFGAFAAAGAFLRRR